MEDKSKLQTLKKHRREGFFLIQLILSDLHSTFARHKPQTTFHSSIRYFSQQISTKQKPLLLVNQPLRIEIFVSLEEKAPMLHHRILFRHFDDVLHAIPGCGTQNVRIWFESSFPNSIASNNDSDDA